MTSAVPPNDLIAQEGPFLYWRQDHADREINRATEAALSHGPTAPFQDLAATERTLAAYVAAVSMLPRRHPTQERRSELFGVIAGQRLGNSTQVQSPRGLTTVTGSLAEPIKLAGQLVDALAYAHAFDWRDSEPSPARGSASEAVQPLIQANNRQVAKQTGEALGKLAHQIGGQQIAAGQRWSQRHLTGFLTAMGYLGSALHTDSLRPSGWRTTAVEQEVLAPPAMNGSPNGSSNGHRLPATDLRARPFGYRQAIALDTVLGASVHGSPDDDASTPAALSACMILDSVNTHYRLTGQSNRGYAHDTKRSPDENGNGRKTRDYFLELVEAEAREMALQGGTGLADVDSCSEFTTRLAALAVVQQLDARGSVFTLV